MLRFLIFFLLALSPLPLASARPIWQWTWVCVIALMTLVLCIRTLRTRLPEMPGLMRWAIGLVGGFIVWGFVQAWLPVGHFVDVGALSAEGMVPGVLSVNPSATLAVSLYFLAHLLFFICVFVTCRREQDPARFVRNLGIIVALYALYGFAVFVTGNKYILWFEKWANPEYLTATFVNRNSFAAYAGLGLLCLLTHAHTQMRTNSINNIEDLVHVFTRVWWLPVSILLVTFSLMLTGSRAGFISVALGVATLLLLNILGGRGERTWQRKKLISAVAITVAAIGIFSFSSDDLGDRLSVGVGNDARLAVYPLVVDAIADQPAAGFGLGTFEESFRIYRTSTIRDLYFDRGHNDYLELAMTAGIPAALVLLLAFAMAALVLWRGWRHSRSMGPYIAPGLAAMVQLAAHSLVDFSLQMPAVSYLWVAVIAVSLAAATKRNEPRGA
ncbi:MAG: O-antigen ligase family protein [Alphaproteobacteria bacterium]|nr:O-antigen ligase family protein [Alphaproteobacteria bacterium]